MSEPHEHLRPGAMVILPSLPPGLVDGLDADDQTAILEIVGKKVLFNEIDEHGRAELQFTDSTGKIHFIWVDPDDLRAEDRQPKTDNR